MNVCKVYCGIQRLAEKQTKNKTTPKVIMKYDMHVASEAGNGTLLREHLARLGFKDDNLVARGLQYDSETAKHYVACPIIDVHASKKVATPEELNILEDEADAAMTETGVTGYWHSESVPADQHLEPIGVFKLHPLPFHRLASRPRDISKVWDLHLAMREDSLVKELRDALVENGLYYLSRLKKTPEGEKKFAVFTVQGVNSLKTGWNFYTRLCEWLGQVNAPSCDIKFERTTAMKLYNSPKAVPPTIDTIEWL